MRSERTVRQPVCHGGHIQLKAGTTSCERCGQPVIDGCPDCNASILDATVSYGRFMATHQLLPPKVCTHCGKPFPWAATLYKAAKSQ
jgi:hypothetical protein